MKFVLIMFGTALGPIVIQAAATPIAQLKCSPGFYLCVQYDPWCNGKETIVCILRRFFPVNHGSLKHGSTIGYLLLKVQLAKC